MRIWVLDVSDTHLLGDLLGLLSTLGGGGLLQIHNLSLLSSCKEQQSGLDFQSHTVAAGILAVLDLSWGVERTRSCSGRKEMNILRLREGRKKGARPPC
jgi:hypothetical protein